MKMFALVLSLIILGFLSCKFEGDPSSGVNSGNQASRLGVTKNGNNDVDGIVVTLDPANNHEQIADCGLGVVFQSISEDYNPWIVVRSNNREVYSGFAMQNGKKTAKALNKGENTMELEIRCKEKNAKKSINLVHSHSIVKIECPFSKTAPIKVHVQRGDDIECDAHFEL